MELFFKFVFFTGSQTAANMALRLVCIQDLAYLLVESFVISWESLGKVFVYGGFRYTEVLRRCPDSSPGLNDVHSQLAGSFFDRVCHTVPSLLCPTIMNL